MQSLYDAIDMTAAYAAWRPDNEDEVDAWRPSIVNPDRRGQERVIRSIWLTHIFYVERGGGFGFYPLGTTPDEARAIGADLAARGLNRTCRSCARPFVASLAVEAERDKEWRVAGGRTPRERRDTCQSCWDLTRRLEGQRAEVARLRRLASPDPLGLSY